jgi:hypothetical protein
VLVSERLTVVTKGKWMAAKELLESVFTQRKSTYDPNKDADEAFEIFSADVILNSYDPSIEDIEDRIVDGRQDGGIDAVFIYVNRVLIAEDTELSTFKHPVDVELIIIQSKNENGFKEGPVDKVASSLPNLMSDYKTAVAQGAFKPDLLSAFGLWHKVLTDLAPEFPTFKVSIWYAWKGEKIPASAKVKAGTLEATIRTILPKADVKFVFVGADKLYELAGQQKLVKAELPVAGTPLFAPNSAFVFLSTLSAYGDFISDDNKAIRSTFFDANVRDYEGSVDVNKDIAETLRDPKPGIDFWWLNNGVTILASKGGFGGGKMTLQNPLIVNGLQTSYELNRWMRSGGSDTERLIMIRVIETTDEDVINSVIKATNYQTKVKPHSLRATEQIHRRIEVFLLGHDIYYDRRRNFYKNLGKPSARTIGIDRLAQAVTALLLERPDIARARPTSLMKDPYYDQIFPSADKAYPLELYRVAAEMMFAVATFMNASTYDRIYKNNLRFHLLTALGWYLGGSLSPNAAQLSKIKINKIGSAPLTEIANWVISEFDKRGATDATAKDEDFTDALKVGWPNAGIS